MESQRTRDSFCRTEQFRKMYSVSNVHSYSSRDLHVCTVQQSALESNATIEGKRLDTVAPYRCDCCCSNFWTVSMEWLSFQPVHRTNGLFHLHSEEMGSIQAQPVIIKYNTHECQCSLFQQISMIWRELTLKWELKSTVKRNLFHRCQTFALAVDSSMISRLLV